MHLLSILFIKFIYFKFMIICFTFFEMLSWYFCMIIYIILLCECWGALSSFKYCLVSKTPHQSINYFPDTTARAPNTHFSEVLYTTIQFHPSMCISDLTVLSQSPFNFHHSSHYYYYYYFFLNYFLHIALVGL